MKKIAAAIAAAVALLGAASIIGDAAPAPHHARVTASIIGDGHHG